MSNVTASIIDTLMVFGESQDYACMWADHWARYRDGDTDANLVNYLLEA